MGDKVKLYVAEAIGENNFDLYGFYTKSEKRCFDLLVSVSGIGPKAALSILSYNTPESLALSIMNDDVKALTVAPGIGKKIAQRVILELKDKMSKEASSQDMQLPMANLASNDNSTVSDAMAALTVLGYSSAELAPVLKKLDVTGMSSEAIIKAVLKQMVK
jgi:Holliday junction DNA helicase RuvA